jgi:hypothetical protein
MGRDDVTREAVLAAIDAYDRLGPEGFKSEYGYSDPTKYALVYSGRSYPSKGIFGAAHIIGLGERIGDLKGGRGVTSRLTKLGFEILDLWAQSPRPALSGARLFIVPASNEPARENFQRSVARAVDPSIYRGVAPESFLNESEIDAETDPLYLWGANGGQSAAFPGFPV